MEWIWTTTLTIIATITPFNIADIKERINTTRTSSENYSISTIDCKLKDDG